MNTIPRHSDSSLKGISGLSPHNIYTTIYYRKAVKRNRYVIFFVAWPRRYGAFRFTDPYGIAASQCVFVSPFVSANQSLEGLYHGSPVVGLLDSAGHYSRDGIIPTSLPSFSTSVPDRQGGLYETLMFYRCTKKQPALPLGLGTELRRLNLSTLSAVMCSMMSVLRSPKSKTKLLSRGAAHQIPFTFINTEKFTNS